MQIAEQVREQTREWGKLMQQHMQSEYELRRVQNHQQLEILKKLMTELQVHQVDEVKEKHESYSLLSYCQGENYAYYACYAHIYEPSTY